MSSEELVEVRKQLRETSVKLAEVVELMQRRERRAEYQRKYYADRKAQKKRKKKAEPVRSGLENPNENNLNLLKILKDRRLLKVFPQWAEVAYGFADSGHSAFNFLQWLTFTWNVQTYWFRPVTRSGGYNHVFIGFSGPTKALRCKYSDNELFGCVKKCSFVTKPQVEAFRDAPWWRWGYNVLGQVVFCMQEEDEKRWDRLPLSFRRPLLLMMGGSGAFELKKGLEFDPYEGNPDKLGKAYGLAKMDLDMCWGACKKGLFAGKEEPFRKFVQSLNVTPM